MTKLETVRPPESFSRYEEPTANTNVSDSGEARKS